MIKAARFPSLDGWRALSIVLVLGDHCQFAVRFPKSLNSLVNWVFDGNLGVRFFFVISGFLITHLLFREHDQIGKINLRNFYFRRAIRILPVYFTYLLVIFVLQFVSSWYQSTATWIGNLTFTTNFLPASGQTIHLWSLAVEEQFYLLWPFLLVMLGLKGNNSRILYTLGAALVIAPICRMIAHAKDAPEILHVFFKFGSFFNNFDSLAIGCIASILLSRQAIRVEALLKKFKRPSIVLSVALIMTPYILTKLSLLVALTVPLGDTCQGIGFAILLLHSVLSPADFKLLNWEVVKRLGVLSYSIYIWQQMFLCNPQNFGFSRFWFMVFPGALVAVFLVAMCSYYGLEKPLLGLRDRLRPSAVRNKNVDRMALI